MTKIVQFWVGIFEHLGNDWNAVDILIVALFLYVYILRFLILVESYHLGTPGHLSTQVSVAGLLQGCQRFCEDPFLPLGVQVSVGVSSGEYTFIGNIRIPPPVQFVLVYPVGNTVHPIRGRVLLRVQPTLRGVPGWVSRNAAQGGVWHPPPCGGRPHAGV